MFVKLKSTRHTAIGTLRMGVVYKLDGTDHRVKKAINPLIEAKVAVVLSEEEAAKAAAETLKIKDGQDAGKADADAVIEGVVAEARDVIATAKAAQAAAEAKVAAVEAERDELGGKLKRTFDQMEASKSEADRQIAALQAEIDALKKPAPDAAEPAADKTKGKG